MDCMLTSVGERVVSFHLNDSFHFSISLSQRTSCTNFILNK